MTKKDQLTWNKTKKTKRVSKNKPTTEEQEYLNWLQNQNYSCFVCGCNSNIEYHHVKLKSTDKKRHNRLIPLCQKHHHGKELSPHGNPRRWREIYSMFEQNERANYMYNDFLAEFLNAD